MAKSQNIDEYIATFPDDTQKILTSIRHTIHKTAPEATEVISYAIPAFRLNGRNLVYFAGWKDHVSLYPIPPVDDELQKQIQPYQTGKGTLQFALDKPIPFEIIQRVVRAHLAQNASIDGAN